MLPVKRGYIKKFFLGSNASVNGVSFDESANIDILGATLNDVKSSRIIGTTYTNGGVGRFVMISITSSLAGGSAQMQCYLNGFEIAKCYSVISSNYPHISYCFYVPPNATYNVWVSSGVVTQWKEI